MIPFKTSAWKLGGLYETKTTSSFHKGPPPFTVKGIPVLPPVDVPAGTILLAVEAYQCNQHIVQITPTTGALFAFKFLMEETEIWLPLFLRESVTLDVLHWELKLHIESYMRLLGDC
jgi:hypothetical protein